MYQKLQISWAAPLKSTDEEDSYKPIKITSVFDNKNNYIEYERKGDKNKNLSVKNYLRMIRWYLTDMINDHKTQERWKVNSSLLISFIFELENLYLN